MGAQNCCTNTKRQQNHLLPVSPRSMSGLHSIQRTQQKIQIKRTQTIQQQLNVKKQQINKQQLNNKLMKYKNVQIPFQNSQQYFNYLYEACSNNIYNFFDQLQQKVSEIYFTITKQVLQKMNQNMLSYDESKILISQEILSFNLNILKVISKKNNHQFDVNIFKKVNKLQKNLVGYLKSKYPRGDKIFVSTDLMTLFKQFDLTQNIQFDILKNANVYFNSLNDQFLSRDIKLFINKILTELDQHYGRFQKIMQYHVFLIKDEQGKAKQLNYKIGRKISQNVSPYDDFHNNTLQIKSPQIFRVMIKWLQHLESMFLSSNQNMNKKKKYKCFIQQNEKGLKIYDKINQDEYYDLINYQLKQKIQKQLHDYNNENEELVSDLERFNSHLIKLFDISERQQKYVPQKQTQIIKYSNLNAKFLSWVLAQKLMLVLKKLIKIGKSFDNPKTSINLDLIQFKVTDLMRSMIIGNTKQILIIYQNLKKLQRQGVIKIIKIKNRLSTLLNDVLIVFSLKDTFILCQIQLIISNNISTTTDKINKKQKNIQFLNHFFYQLERSPYGILSQTAVLLAYKDSKISYQDNIKFKPNNIKIQKCQQQHHGSIFEIQKQNKPFICTNCTKFYFKYENIFIMKYCIQCNIFVCSKCIFANNKELQTLTINKALQQQIQKAISKSNKKQKNFSQSNNNMCSQSNINTTSQSNNNKLSISNNSSLIIQLFKKPYQKLQSIFNAKSVQVSKLSSYLSKKYKQFNMDGKQIMYFSIVQFKSEHTLFKQFIYNPVSKQIQNPFKPKQTFTSKTKITFSPYDLILFYQNSIVKSSKRQQLVDLQENMIFLYASKQDLVKLLHERQGQAITVINLKSVRLVVNVQPSVKVLGVNRDDRIKQQDDNQKLKNKCNKQFPYESLNDILGNLPDLALSRNVINLNDIGIKDKHLRYFKQIKWSTSIKQLVLTKNKLQTVSDVLSQCTNLQQLYINQNFIKKLQFRKPLPNIQIINAANNQIYQINGVDKIKNINKFILQGNKLQSFPYSQLPKLKILNLKKNTLVNYHNIYNSNLPLIQQIFIQSYEDTNYTQNKLIHSKNLQKIVIPYQNLRNFQTNNKVEQISIKSKKIQRINLYQNKLKSIQIFNIDNLKYLLLPNNLIENIDFLFNQKRNYQNHTITQIDMRQNKMKKLPIMKSDSLQKVDLSKNEIQQIKNIQKSIIPNLNLISLQQNLITQIPIMNFPKLQTMILIYNPIQKIDNLQKSNLQSLKIFNLAQTKNIDNIPRLSLKSLIQISINDIHIKTMSNLTQSRLPCLKTLKINYCFIKQFPILKIQTLETLNLKDSLASNLDNLQLCELYNLKDLSLAFVTIDNQEQYQGQIAKQQVFSCKLNFPNLINLDLTGSNLKKLNGLQDSNLPNIQTIQLKQSKNKVFPKLAFRTLKKLTASNCQIKQIDSIITNKLKSIQQIDLSFNDITLVNMELPSIKILNLSYNSISAFNQNTQFKQLHTLKLNNNCLVNFPLLKANKLKYLEINDNAFQHIHQLNQAELVSLQTLSILNGNLSQQPFPILNFPCLKQMFITRSQLIDVQNLSKCQLPKIQIINFSGNSIKNIPKLQLLSLKQLNLSDNQIQSIKSLQNSNCPKLTQINISQNLIQQIPKLPFINLTHLNCQQNKITKITQFNKSQFKHIQQLDFIKNAQLNQWPKLNCNIEKFYGSQTKLYQSININQLKGLISIYLNNNGIISIPKFNHKQIQIIQLMNNQITSIDQFAQKQYPYLISLAFNNNKIKKVPLLKMKKLKGIWFNQNQLQDIDGFLNSQLPQLQMLSLQKNNIKKIKKLPFPNIYDIYLNKNPLLQELTCFNLPQYPRIQSIVVAQTSIKKVQVLPLMPNLQNIWLNNNKIKQLQWLNKSCQNLPKLKLLNVKNNQIKTYPNLKLPNLRSVYLTQNPIQDVNKLLQLQKAYVNVLQTVQISIKSKNDDQFNKITKKIYELGNNFLAYKYAAV